MYKFFTELLPVASRWRSHKSAWLLFNGENKIIDEFLENMKLRSYDKETYILI